MENFRFHHRLDVRFRDCDPMRHVNHAVYLTYLEQARFAYWRHVIGDDATASGVRSFILARVMCDYRAPASMGDLLEVAIRVSSLGRSSFTCEYQIGDAQDGRLLATATTVQVMYDYARGKSVPIPDEVRAKIVAFEGPDLESRRASMESDGRPTK